LNTPNFAIMPKKVINFP